MVMDRPCLAAALALAVSSLGACGGAKASSGDAPTTPAAPAAGDCRLEGTWTLELTWTDPVAPACGDVTVPWDTALGFAMKPGGEDAEPDSAWGGSDVRGAKPGSRRS